MDGGGARQRGGAASARVQNLDPDRVKVDLSGALQQRSSPRRPPPAKAKAEDSELNTLLDYGGNSYLARTKKIPEGWISIAFLSLGAVFCVCLAYYVYFNYHEFHYNLSRAYASLGHAKAQHIVGERLLHGVGVEKDEAAAMRYFRMAADQGHPHAAYNLAVGHMQGIETDVQPGEAHHLIKHAHDNGVEEAEDVLVSKIF